MPIPTDCSASVSRWTGHAVLALRTAQGLTARAFADTVGVSARDVQVWENDATAPMSAAQQAALDAVLARADPQIQARVHALLAPPAAPVDEGRP